MDSFLLVDKPLGISSPAFMRQLYSKYGFQKAGHCGTLDTNASGLMIIAAGSCLRHIGLFEGLRKTYMATISFHSDIQKPVLEKALKKFTSAITQLPPRRSAVARKPRIKNIYSIDLLEFSKRKANVQVTCDAGTYIRVLAADIGLYLGTRAHLSQLRRISIGPFSISHASEKPYSEHQVLEILRHCP